MSEYSNLTKTKQAIDGLSDLIKEFSKIAEEKAIEVSKRDDVAKSEKKDLENKIESLKKGADKMVNTIDNVINKIELVKKENGTSSNNS